jgi:queuine tRNA-ribosyltransferase
MGGLHRFMGWDGPILTDSGGFQVMSLASLRKIDETGVTFRSHIDGSGVPDARSARSPSSTGWTDMVMAFDECTPFPATEEQAAASMVFPCAGPAAAARPSSSVRDTACSASSRAAPTRPPGGIGARRCRRSASTATRSAAWPSASPGARCSRRWTHRARMLPAGRPRYLMGVGRPEDILGAVRRGIDMFDCVMPTRSGRTAQGFTRRGTVNIRNARHARRPAADRRGLRLPGLPQPSRAYLHHLVTANEILGSMLLTWHNLQYYQDLMPGCAPPSSPARRRPRIQPIMAPAPAAPGAAGGPRTRPVPALPPSPRACRRSLRRAPARSLASSPARACIAAVGSWSELCAQL